MRRSRRRGFTLIEVLVAVAILGIGITAIFSSQWVSFATVKHARYVNEASGLARCKMSEVEWDLEQNGYQVTEVTEQGPCCEGIDSPEITCAWTISPVEFPEPKFGDLDLESELDLGTGPSLLGGGVGGPGAGGVAGAAALGFLKTGATAMEKNGDVSGIADSFLGGSDGAADGIAGLVMQIVYPDLKAIFEAGTRKITVTVSWYEGRRLYTADLEQWVTSSEAAGIGANLNGLLETDDGEEDDATTPSSKNPSSKTPSKTPSKNKDPKTGRGMN